MTASTTVSRPSVSRALVSAEGTPGRILVCRLDSMGDVLLAAGAVRAVAREAEVTLLVGPAGRAAAELLPGVRDLIEFDAPWVPLEPGPVRPDDVDRLVATVAEFRFDAAFIMTSFHQSPLPLALLLRLAGVPWIGAASIDYPGSLLDLRHRPDSGLHEAERNVSLVAAAGFSADERGAVGALRQPLPDVASWTGDQPYVVLHPGAAVSARRPSADRAAELAKALRRDGRRVLVTGGRQETALTAHVAVAGAEDLGGRLDLAELAAVLAGAEVAVVPNTGPAHLAAAVGTPVVSLFAPVVPSAQWAPYGVPVIVLGDQQAPCRDSRSRNCPVAGHPCLDAIRPGDVVEAVSILAGATGPATAIPIGGRL
ncbi:MAG: hypothetical protein QOF52_2247 [Propionibacteriaceae bacterium]|jgi:ADP-heptose:LPS heptosyltransferase|nr:glycosyl transferase [Propionibacteriaceae bacterium]MDX6322389.1 hypothetical protein [Propionibacteriaceae bacterium]